MPPIPAWHGRIPQIRAALTALDAPALDRAQLQQLFGIERRRAQILMAQVLVAQIEPPRQGRSSRLRREALLAWLDSLEAHRGVGVEIARRLRLRATLAGEQPGVAAPSIPTPAAASPLGLPRGITLAAPGELRLRFASPGELLGAVLALTEQYARDPHALLETLGAVPPADEP